MSQAAIPEGQLARITKSLHKLDELQSKFTTTMVEAESFGVAEFMTPKLVEKARALRAALDDLLVIYERKVTSKTAARGEMRAQFEGAKNRSEQINVIEKQIQCMLELSELAGVQCGA